MKQDFVINRWGVWPPQENSADIKAREAELLSDIPRMLKRRLSPLARIVLCASRLCLETQCLLPSVFSSSHGELAKSFQMMEMLEAGEEISPTAFSLSVHNAIAGLFSMVYQNKMQSTVVAPGEEGIAAAFIEALGLLQEGAEQVLIVLYDEPLVAFYPSEPYQLSTDNSIALALTISRTGSGTPISLSCLEQTGQDGEQPLQVPMLIDFLQQHYQQLVISNPRHSWCWQKNVEIH